MRKGRTAPIDYGKREYFIFLVSLLLILSVPLVSLSLFYSRYFAQQYTEKLLSQAQGACMRTQVYFEQTVSQCEQTARLLEHDALLREPSPNLQPQMWSEISRKLDQSRILNNAIIEIVYQPADSSVVFTSSRAFYEALGEGDGFYRLAQTPTRPGFYKKAFISVSESAPARTAIAYTVPLSDGQGLLSFWLDADMLLPQPGNAQQGGSVLLSDNNLLVWGSGQNDSDLLLEQGLTAPENSFLKSEDGHYFLMRAEANSGGASVVYVFPYRSVLGEIESMGHAFALFLQIEALACVMLIVLLGRRSYRPLRSFYGSILKHAPELLPPARSGEIQAAEYALTQFSMQKRDLWQEHLLHGLFTGRTLEEEALHSAGIGERGGSFMVVCLSLRGEEDAPLLTKLCEALSGILVNNGVERYATDYVKGKSRLFLLEFSQETEVAALLTQAQTLLSQQFSESFSLQNGAALQGTNNVWQSYCQAVHADTTLTPPPGDAPQSALHENSFSAYPSAELDAVSNAIAKFDLERIQFLSDSLRQQIRLRQGSFFALCLGYATLGTLLRGISVLEEEKGDAVDWQFSPALSTGQILQEIDRLLNKVILLIQQKQENQQVDGFERVLQYINQNIDNPEISVAFVGESLDISPAVLGRLFHERMGVTISEYMGAMRHEYIKKVLWQSDLSISEIAQRLGYSQTSSFIRRFKNVEGITPGEYRDKLRESSRTV